MTLAPSTLQISDLQLIIDAAMEGRNLIKSAVSITSGFFNRVYKLGFENDGDHLSSAVVRIGPSADYPLLAHEHGMMQAELEWYALLSRQTDIPVPEVYGSDLTLQIIPYPFMILETIEGEPMDEVRDHLPLDERNEFDRNFGELIFALHSIKGPRFGYPHVSHLNGSSWRAVFEAMFNAALEDTKRMCLQSRPAIKRFESIWSMAADAIVEPEFPSLIHWDLKGHNVLASHETGKITGVLDWERAFWGSPAAEHHWFHMTSGQFEGYGVRSVDGLATAAEQHLSAIYVTLIQIAVASRRNTSDVLKQAFEVLESRTSALKGSL